MPNNVALFEYTTFCSYICQLMDMQAVSTFELLEVMLFWAFIFHILCVWFLCRHVFASFRYTPKSVIAGSYGNFMFNILKNCQTVFQTFYIPTNSWNWFQFFHILTNTCYLSFYLIFIIFYLFFYWHIIQLTYSVVLVSGLQESDSVIYIYIYIYSYSFWL